MRHARSNPRRRKPVLGSDPLNQTTSSGGQYSYWKLEDKKSSPPDIDRQNHSSKNLKFKNKLEELLSSYIPCTPFLDSKALIHQTPHFNSLQFNSQSIKHDYVTEELSLANSAVQGSPLQKVAHKHSEKGPYWKYLAF